MRLTSFLLGGVVGAAAVMYMYRNNKQMMVSFSQMGDNMTKMMDKFMMNVADKGINARLGKQNQNNDKANLNQVEELMNKDPHVKTEVNEILTQNHVTTH